jgi:hypothetical protein
MAKKNVTSSDYRKPAITAALKRRSGCRKVTQVTHDTVTDTFRGNCLSPSGPDSVTGFHTVAAVECGFRRLTDEQHEALKQYAAENGSTWKTKLAIDWQFARAQVNGQHSALLQQVRNQFGPSWLVGFKLEG